MLSIENDLIVPFFFHKWHSFIDPLVPNAAIDSLLTVITISFFFTFRKKIWMDEVNCTGAENDVRKCQHGGWKMSDCGNNEDAGVRCHHPHAQEPPVSACVVLDSVQLCINSEDVLVFMASSYWQ